MRPFVDWFFVVFVLVFSSAYVLRNADADAAPRPGEALSSSPAPATLWPATLYAYAAPDLAPPITLPDESWCEPARFLPCASDSDCPTAPDGTAFRCVRNWVRDGEASSRVCMAAYPSRAVREWRADRLRVLVDAICERRNGCDPVALHAYLTTLAMRETTLRPWKVHRLSGDVDANTRAWRKYADRYRDSPAAGEPGRWFVGRGYFGANAASVLHVWDANEIPEALCGEVEAVLVHLRTARRRLRRLHGGVVCGGREHHGTASGGEASWYDVSLANTGSDPCPGVSGRRLASREGFARRARSRGLSPYGRVTLAMLGREVPRDEQRRFASDVRRRMDAAPPPG